MKKLLFCISTIMLITGCGSVLTGISSNYPKGWPTIQISQGCPDLTGSYQTIGEYSYQQRRHSNNLLARIGGSLFNLDLITLESLTLESSPGFLRVTVINSSGDKIEKTLSESSGDFSCEEGALIFSPVIQKIGDGTGGYRASQRLSLKKVNDGSIVGEDRLFNIGAVMWLVPIAGFQTFWYRWHPIN
jgi:hypothetical protein